MSDRIPYDLIEMGAKRDGAIDRARAAEAKLARIRELHVRDQDGAWICGDPECPKCNDDNGHTGPVCSYCSDPVNDDPDFPSIMLWPCPTVQIIDDLPASGPRALE